MSKSLRFITFGAFVVLLGAETFASDAKIPDGEFKEIKLTEQKIVLAASGNDPKALEYLQTTNNRDPFRSFTSEERQRFNQALSKFSETLSKKPSCLNPLDIDGHLEYLVEKNDENKWMPHFIKKMAPRKNVGKKKVVAKKQSVKGKSKRRIHCKPVTPVTVEFLEDLEC